MRQSYELQGGAGEDGQWFELPYLYAGSGTADCGGDRGAVKGDCDGCAAK
jgi:hypothetical protein|nr:hypothetical protein [Phocaeicola dorei]